MKKIVSLVVIAICLFAAPAFAAPVAKVTITGRNVNLRAQPGPGGDVIRQASSPEFFIGEEATVRDSAGEEWRKIVYSFNEANDCVHEIEMYVSAKFSTASRPDAQYYSRQIRDYEAGKKAFAASSEWEDVTAQFEGKNIGTFAWTDASVHAEPDPDSRVVGILPMSPKGRDAANPDVYISGWRLYKYDDPRVGFKPFGVWWRVEKPIKGWVEGWALGVINSGLLGGV